MLSDVALHFKAMQVFLSSSSGAPYLSEYLEADGLFVTLNALSCIIAPSNPDLSRATYLSSNASDMCSSAFELLRLVAVAGRLYKEILCECGVLIQVSSIMRGSMNSTVNHDGRTLLLELGSGNPKYQNDVLYTILQILPCTNPVCQRMAAQITRAFMSTLSFRTSGSGASREQHSLRRSSRRRVNSGNNGSSNTNESTIMSFVPAAVSMTRSVDLQVQYEAVELLSVLARDCPAAIPAIVAGLLPLARNPIVDKDSVTMEKNKNTNAVEKKYKINAKQAEEMNELFNNYNQIVAAANSWQASAIRALEKLVNVVGVGRTILQQGGVYVLLGALLNVTNIDAQDVALETLIILCNSDEATVVDRRRNNQSVGTTCNAGQRNETVGGVARLAVTNVLTVQQWDRLRVLTTTVGYEIDGIEHCNQRIVEQTCSPPNTTIVELSPMHIKLIVHNLYACRMISEQAASVAVKQSGASSPTQTKPKRRALSLHMVPETSIEHDDNEYRELMERLIRSSLPELMDRDFSTAGKAAFNKRRNNTSNTSTTLR